jgi:peroxiredoxin (alkyl hydroperoxide reductase subunit C)
VIVPQPGSCGAAKERMEGQEAGVTCVDWFFCTKEISADEIDAAIRST